MSALRGGTGGVTSVGFLYLTCTVMVPDSFGPPAIALGRTRGYVTKKKKKKKKILSEPGQFPYKCGLFLRT